MTEGPDLFDRSNALFEDEPDRLSRLSLEVAGIYFDWSKTHLDHSWIAVDARAPERGCGFDAAREALFAGAVVNPSERRAATHVAERGNGGKRSGRFGRQAPNADAGAGRCGRGRRVREVIRRPPHRHRRIGARARRCWSMRWAGQSAQYRGALPVQHRRPRVRGRGPRPRPRRRPGRGGVQDFHHQRDPAQSRRRAGWLRAGGVEDPMAE